jgi:DNA repair protein RecO (recombination protein O)
MLIHTEGIILHKTPYSDHSLILKIYTEKYGTHSFIVKNALSKSHKNRFLSQATLFLVEVVYNPTAKTQLYYPKEITPLHVNTLIPYDMARSSLLIFYNELLYKILYDAGEDAKLFSFLKDSILQLDDKQEQLKDIHIRFMIKLMHLLGFAPEAQWETNRPYFSLENACFTKKWLPDNPNYMSKAASHYFYQLLQAAETDFITTPEAQKPLRLELLHHLINFFQMHNEHLKNIASLDILIELFKE